MRSFNRCVRSLGLALCASLCFAHPLRAGQAPDTSVAARAARPLPGRVVKDGAPVPGAAVTLHRVTSGSSGPIGSSSTDGAGRFRFALTPADTGFSVFFVTVEHQSVRYFGTPVHFDQPTADYTIEVFDTTSSLPPGGIRTTRRDLVLVAQQDGGWEVNEVVRIRNTMRRTLVPGADGSTWNAPLPDNAGDFEAGEEDAASAQLRRVGDRVFLISSVVPGDRELYLRYRIPPRPASIRFPATQAVDTVNLYVRQPSPEVTVAGLTASTPLTVEGERFLRFVGTGIQPTASVSVRWSGGAGGPLSPVVAGVAAAVLVLAAGSWLAYRNRDAAPTPRAVDRAA